MTITWFGTASIALESASTRLLFDPFLRRNRRLTPLDYPDFTGFDALFLTHGHFDHLVDVPELMRRDRAVIAYGTGTPCRALEARGIEKARIRPLDVGDTVTVGDFQVTVHAGRHIRFNLPYILSILPGCALHLPQTLKLLRLLKALPENGETVAFEIRCEGKTVFLMGSFGMPPAANYPFGADLLVFPFSGNTAVPALAEAPLRELLPKKILFDHFDDSFPPLTKHMKVENYRAQLGREYTEMEVIIPEEKMKYTV